MDYGDFKDLPRTAASDKVLPNKTFNVAKNSNRIGINMELLASMI